MAGSQIIIITGIIGKEIELQYTQGGMAIANFNIATSRKKKDGEEKTSWHRCKAFSKTAEVIGQYFGKGSWIQVTGEMDYGSYEKDGITKYTADVMVNQFNFVGPKQDRQNDQPSGGQGGYNPNNQRGQQGGGQRTGGYPKDQGGYQQEVHGGYQQGSVQGGNQGGNQGGGGGQQSGGQGEHHNDHQGGNNGVGQQGENYPQPPDDNIPF
jgi:single-strand DNA-binding protein